MTEHDELTIAELEVMAARAIKALDKSGWLIPMGKWWPIVRALLASQKALEETLELLPDRMLQAKARLRAALLKEGG